jgi:hypothetical protein
MPFIPPLIAAASAAFATISLTQVVVGTLISAGLSALSAVLAKGTKSDLGSRGQNLTAKGPVEWHDIIYGRVRTGGKFGFWATSQFASNSNGLLHYCVIVAGHEIDAIEAVYFGDEEIPLDANGEAIGFYNGFVRASFWYGTPDQLADPALVAAIPQQITAAHRARGCAGVRLTLLADTEGRWPNGFPKINFRVRGRKVYDPRDAGQNIGDPTTWKWSENGILCTADYMRGVPGRTTTSEVKREYGCRETDDRFDWTNIAIGASVCDEAVPLAAGGTQKRYTINGVISSGDSPQDVLPKLFASIGGAFAPVGDKISMWPGYYRIPSAHLTDADLVAPPATMVHQTASQAFNTVKGVYVDLQNYAEPQDFPAVSIPAYRAIDGEELIRDLEFPFTNNAAACQRLARLLLYRERQEIVTTRRYNLRPFNVAAGDVVTLDDPREGWVTKPFECQKVTVMVEPDANGVPVIMIELVLKETAPEVYLWTTDLETLIDPAPNTSLPDPRNVAPPGAPGIAERQYVIRRGAGVRTEVTVSWTPSTAFGVVGYELQYRVVGAAAWIDGPMQASTVRILPDVSAGQYDFRVRAVTHLGAKSAWVQSPPTNVVGLSARPSALTTPQIEVQGNQARLTWSPATELDVIEGGEIQFRYSPLTTGVTWDNAVSIGQPVPGGEGHAVLPSMTGTYLLRAVDSTGNASNTVSIVAKQQSQHAFTGRAGSPFAQQPGWSGIKTGLQVASGRLTLSGAGQFDTIADFDAVADLDGFGGLATTGTYQYAATIDFGAVVRSRMTSQIVTATVVSGDTIDARTQSIDDWEDFDGAAPGAADAWQEFRQTDDDPGGSPVWSAWNRFHVAEVEARAVQIRLQAVVESQAYNIEIIEASTKVEAVS